MKSPANRKASQSAIEPVARGEENFKAPTGGRGEKEMEYLSEQRRKKVVIKKLWGWKSRWGIMSCGHSTRDFFPQDTPDTAYCSFCSQYSWWALELRGPEGYIRVVSPNELYCSWNPGGFPSEVESCDDSCKVVRVVRMVKDAAEDLAEDFQHWYFSGEQS